MNTGTEQQRSARALLLAGALCFSATALHAVTNDPGGKEVDLGRLAIADTGSLPASVRAFLLEQNIVPESDPAFAPLARYVTEWTFPTAAGGFNVHQTALAKAQAGIVLLHQELSALTAAKAPAAWLDGIKPPLAWSLVYANVRQDQGLAARVIPVLPGATLAEATPASIQTALEKIWPGLSKAAPEIQKAVWDELDALNPGLLAVGWERLVPGSAPEPWPHLVLSVGGHTLRYRWQPLGGPVLVPSRAHLETIAQPAKPLRPEFVAHPAPPRWTVTLDCPAALPGRPPEDLQLYLVGEGNSLVSATGILPNQQNKILLLNAVDQATADSKQLPPFGAYYDTPVWPKTLTRTGNALRGHLLLGAPGRPTTRYHLELNVKLEGKTVTGTFETCAIAKAAPVPPPDAPLLPGDTAPLVPAAPPRNVLLRGRLTGVDGFPRGEALPADRVWSTFQGNTGSGSAGDVPMPPVVAELSDAKLSWISHDLLPHGEGSDLRASRPPGESVMGGFASPAVGAGRVVLAYYRPAGTRIPKFFLDRDGKTGAALVEADDVVQAFDPATGATLWKTVFPLKSANRGTMHKSGFQGSPFVHGDAVYVMGNLLRMYCLDLATGLPRWESDLGPGHQRITRVFGQALEKGVHIGGTGKSDASEWTNRGLQGNPRIIDGVLVVHDGQRWNAGFVGLDPATGKRLWHVSGAGSTMVPLVWPKEGREYVIGVGGGGFTSAIDPKDGRVLWRLMNFDGGYIGASAVCGDILVGFDETTKRRAGYRMSRTGCTKVWELPAEQTGSRSTPVTAHNGRLYCFSADTKRLQVLDPETGKLLATAEHAGGAVIEHGSLIVGAGDRLFTDNGRELPGLFVWDVAEVPPRSLSLLPAPRNAGYAVAVTPALVDGRMFLRLHDRLAAWDLRR